jgi:hypothetical protein
MYSRRWFETMKQYDKLNVVVGTPVYRAGSYALDKFLENQEQIQQKYPDCELLFATCEPDFVADLEQHIAQRRLRAKVVYYTVQKPAYAKNRTWNIVCGREAIRRHLLDQTDAEALLFLDADMTYDPDVVEVLLKEISGYGAVFNGCALLDDKRRDNGFGLSGFGCVMFTRKTLQKIKFRCYEFKNGDVISADDVFEMDMFSSCMRIRKGFFITSYHFKNANEASRMSPRKMDLGMKIKHIPLIRYGLIRASIIFQRHIPWRLRQLFAGRHIPL